MSLAARRIRVTGIVQGVGFRPFVWRLAQELELAGWVRNDALGVEIAAEGAYEQVQALLARLRAEAPPLARVDKVHAEDAPARGLAGFRIAASAGGQSRTAIGADVAVCADCLEELFDPRGRRWRHAFITCTHCGPRYTVTRALPYDRAQTSLQPFPLCAACAAEYTAESDRRYHAETTCCPACGPRLALRDARGESIPGDPIAATLDLLRSGAVVAIKGLGGFQLACNARDAAAVARLRARKNREQKPFAVMAANIASLEGLADCNAQERFLLESRERPIVLLRAHAAGALTGLAPGLQSMGVMLPTTPIHYLLLHEAAGRPAGSAWLAAPQELLLVMTSANPGGEPIACGNREAGERLAGIADAILEHDRDIVARCDDSVVRALGDSVQYIRRSRGHAAYPIRLPYPAPSVLAFGAQMKGGICMTRGDQAFLAPHLGALDNAATCIFFDETVARLLDLIDIRPQIVVHDLHPDYYSTRAALAFAARLGLKSLAVAHHHAHIAAVCAEHRERGPVLGLALDGMGLGPDGQAWGGEMLQIVRAECVRLGSLRALPLPGADRAAREPWRMAAAALHRLGRSDEIGRRFKKEGGETLVRMLDQGIQCPTSSSMGRVFDAAAGLLGLCTHMQYEAQAAILLEQAAMRHIERNGWPPPMEGGWNLDTEGALDLLPLLAGLEGAADTEAAAARFHATLVSALGAWTEWAARRSGLGTVAWGGGCFLNALLATGLRRNLESRGIKVIAPLLLGPGDAAVALGQAWVAIESGEQ